MLNIYHAYRMKTELIRIGNVQERRLFVTQQLILMIEQLEKDCLMLLLLYVLLYQELLQKTLFDTSNFCVCLLSSTWFIIPVCYTQMH
jgi:hypothetical protein